MIILVGASASGKTEVAKYLIKNYGFEKVVTFTTRVKRPSEIDKIDYNFVTKDQFLKLKDENFFVETTYYNGNYYGTPKNEIALNKVLIVDPNGLKCFINLSDKSIVTFLIYETKEKRRERMILRGDNIKDVEQRLINDKVDFDQKNIEKTNFEIDGDNLTIQQMSELIYNDYKKTVKIN